MGSVKKALNWLLAGAFLLVCALTLLFFAPLTETGGSLPVLSWESAELCGPDGETSAFDPGSEPPECGEGEYYVFTLTLPERGGYMSLIFDGATGVNAITLDGAELCSSSAEEEPVSLRLSIGPGGGEELRVVFRPEGLTGVFPPSVQLTDDPTNQRESIAYANFYAVPAGATALTFVLLTGLFLLGAAYGRVNWRLLLLIFASAQLTVGPLIDGFGSYFFPEWAIEVFSLRVWDALAALAIAAYLALHRSKRFWRLLGLLAAGSAAAVLVCYVVSCFGEGYLARYIPAVLSEAAAGYWSGLLSWLTLWLELLCALLSGWDMLRSISDTRTRAKALELKNQLVLENYRSLEAKLREGAELRHEFAHRLTVLDAYAKAGDYEAVARSLEEWRGSSADGSARYCEHIAVNAMLQDAAARARERGIEFRASAIVPRELNISDDDLCRLLMNMLDNAVEGAERTPEGRRKFVRVRLRSSEGFLAVSCENSFDGRVLPDGRGGLLTTKTEGAHGLGLAQMRAVAEKYSSVLELSRTDGEFTVQTALKNVSPG